MSTSIQCRCGHRLILEIKRKGQAVRCPVCGRRLAPVRPRVERGRAALSIALTYRPLRSLRHSRERSRVPPERPSTLTAQPPAPPSRGRDKGLLWAGICVLSVLGFTLIGWWVIRHAAQGEMAAGLTSRDRRSGRARSPAGRGQARGGGGTARASRRRRTGRAASAERAGTETGSTGSAHADDPGDRGEVGSLGGADQWSPKLRIRLRRGDGAGCDQRPRHRRGADPPPRSAFPLSSGAATGGRSGLGSATRIRSAISCCWRSRPVSLRWSCAVYISSNAARRSRSSGARA